MRSLALLVLLLFTASAVAQSTADVSITVDPESLEIEPRKHVQQEGQEPERQFFDVHVTAVLECSPLLRAPPVPVSVNASGATSVKGTYGSGEEVEFLRIEPVGFDIPWQNDGSGRYSVDHTQRITVISNAALPANATQFELGWNSGWQSSGSPEARQFCDAEGFAWFGQSDPHFITAFGTGPTGTDAGSETGEEPTAAPLLLPVLALAGLAAKKREEG